MKTFYNKKPIITLIFCVLTSLCFAQTDIWDGTATTWTHGGNNEYGGMAKPSEIMRDPEFVTMLNVGGNNFVSDVIPNINDGYPLLDWQLHVGIDEIDNNTDCQLNIYPNPAKNRVTISGEEIEGVSIYNITGQLVTKKMFIGKEL